MRVRMLSVYCILKVKYCIKLLVLMCTWIWWTLSIKTWLIFHTWQHFSALLIYHIAKEKQKRFQIILAGTMCTFPISFYVCVHEDVCVSVCSLTVIFGFSGATRFVFCKKMIPFFIFLFFFKCRLHCILILSIQNWNQIYFIGVHWYFPDVIFSLKLHNLTYCTVQHISKPLFFRSVTDTETWHVCEPVSGAR